MTSMATLGSVASLVVLAVLYVLTRRAYIKRARQLDAERKPRASTRPGNSP